MKLANEALRNRDLVAQIMMELENIEFEDRKHALVIITELYNSHPEIMAEALYPRRHEIVKALLEKYSLPANASIVGHLLRVFTKSPVCEFSYSLS